MTVLENLQMGAWLRRDTVTVRHEMNEIFERFPRLGERQHQLAGLLPAANNSCWPLTAPCSAARAC
jgi:ABC-type branched-subunit amino acid transport system ATPase component